MLDIPQKHTAKLVPSQVFIQCPECNQTIRQGQLATWIQDHPECPLWHKECYHAMMTRNSVEDSRFYQTELFIKATFFEKNALKIVKAPGNTNPMHIGGPNWTTWQENTCGYALRIGKLAGQTVEATLWWAEVDGHLVCFYHGSSNVVDDQMIEQRLDFLSRKDRRVAHHNNFMAVIAEMGITGQPESSDEPVQS